MCWSLKPSGEMTRFDLHTGDPTDEGLLVPRREL